MLTSFFNHIIAIKKVNLRILHVYLTFYKNICRLTAEKDYTMKVILPKTLCRLEDIIFPLFFLAGPVKGGDDWQYTCCKAIARHFDTFTAVIPIPYKNDHPLVASRIPGKEDHFVRQLSWEREYLNLAYGESEPTKKGCVIFWLPEESKINPRKHGPYARDTYGELGEARGRLMTNPKLRVVIGAEDHFPGLSVIQGNFNQALNRNFNIHWSLRKTVEAAVQVATL